MKQGSRWLALIAALAITGPASTCEDCPAVLKRLVAERRSPDLRVPDFSALAGDVVNFYEPTYELVWTRQGRPAPQAEAMIMVLRSAAIKGLNAEDYDGSRWPSRLESLRQAGRTPSAAGLAGFDLALTVSAMRFVSHLHVGRVNPRLYRFGFDFEHEKYDLAGLIRACLAAKDLPAAVSAIEPPFPGYRRTQAALQNYLAIAGEGEEPGIPVTVKPVEPGSPYTGAGVLARLLRRLGDLPPGISIPEDLYQGALVDAVRRFQSRHGLDPDGRIGSATFKQLNTPLSRRLRQLQLTLERYRWAPHRFDRPPIVVNIPEFRVRAMNESFVAELAMKIVAGHAYGHQTPVFARELKYVVFRPYWEVPPSIQRAELVPKIARDKAYLTRNGYEVVASTGTIVGNSTIDGATMAQLRSGRARIRQVPGARNSLGLIKFLFPNEYNVYMHGTPATELFSKSRRDFSHGCIRLEDPEALAAWVLSDKPEWTRERIAQATRGAKTITVTLDRPIPVLIVYATAVVQEDGEVDFFEDIYGQDAALERILAEGHPYLRTDLTSGAPGRRPHE